MLHSSNTRGMASWDRPPSPTTGSQNTYVLKEGGAREKGGERGWKVEGDGMGVLERVKMREWECIERVVYYTMLYRECVLLLIVSNREGVCN